MRGVSKCLRDMGLEGVMHALREQDTAKIKFILERVPNNRLHISYLKFWKGCQNKDEILCKLCLKALTERKSILIQQSGSTKHKKVPRYDGGHPVQENLSSSWSYPTSNDPLLRTLPTCLCSL